MFRHPPSANAVSFRMVSRIPFYMNWPQDFHSMNFTLCDILAATKKASVEGNARSKYWVPTYLVTGLHIPKRKLKRISINSPPCKLLGKLL